MFALNKCAEKKDAKESAQEIADLIGKFAHTISRPGDRTDKTFFTTLHCILRLGDEVRCSKNPHVENYSRLLQQYCSHRASPSPTNVMDDLTHGTRSPAYKR